MSPIADCAFCAEAARRPAPNLFVDELGPGVGDRYVLAETDQFVVMPSIGALTAGYSLILPKVHVRSIGHLTRAELRALGELLDDVAERLVREFGGRVLFYEHGPVSLATQAGSCADHAHVHVIPVPGHVDLATPFRRDHPTRPVNGLDATRLQVDRNEPYLLLGEHGGDLLISAATAVVSQHFRRELAAQLGRPDEWDWVMYTQAANVWATIDRYPRRSCVS